MSFSSDWEQAFSRNTHISRWPWSDLVTYVNRYANPDNGYRRVLEIGCAVGANIPFFRALGVEYFGVEGSLSAVEKLRGFHPDLMNNVAVADFSKDLVFEGPFDLVVDRCALTCNNVAATRRTLAAIVDKLRSNGKYIGIDWFSTRHVHADAGERMDSHTLTNITSPVLSGMGPIQFVDEAHLRDLLTTAGLIVERLEHKTTEVTYPGNGLKSAWWHVVARKP